MYELSPNPQLSADFIPRLTDYGFKECIFASFPKFTSTESEGDKKPFPPLFYDVAWIAPELLHAYQPDAQTVELDFNKTDVYSYGVLFCEIVTREDPFPGYNNMAVGVLVAGQGLRPEIPDFVPDPLVCLN